MIRQGTYHTERFGDRFIKVSTTVPAEWVEHVLRERFRAGRSGARHATTSTRSS